MPLTPGTRLGPFELVSSLGSGGMGEVYRATDTKLKRQVAIKVLPPSLAADRDRLARFQREAEVLASLNHPNIAAIYGLEESDGITALVMELVEGDDLSQLIARLRAPGASAGLAGMPLDEVLPIAKQIAEALEAAHEQGIIHRDLKPANIKVRRDGTVKVLDFGLAKALAPAGSKEPAYEDLTGHAGSDPAYEDLTQSPTITSPAHLRQGDGAAGVTGAGIILGTAAYMSPEQAKARPVDKRADIWAFGVVLFEMLAGRRPFDGEDMADVLGAVVRLEPQWEALPSDLPLPIRTLLQSCLVKDPRRRVADISTALFVLDKAAVLAAVPAGAKSQGPGPSAQNREPVGRWRRALLPAVAAALLVGAAVAAVATWALMRPTPVTLQPVRFAIVPPAAQALAVSIADRNLVLSADGRHLVYVAGPEAQLMVRAIDALDAVPLRGITGARSPFPSPDGRWVGFSTNTELRKVALAGGAPVTLCPFVGAPRGASWGPDGTIVFATGDPATGLLRVAAGGGTPTVLTTPDAAKGEADHIFPSILPNGRAVLFTITSSSGGIETAQVAVQDLTTGHTTTLLRGGSQAEYVAPSTGSGQAGYLVYAFQGTLRAVRFDAATLTVGSDPVPVVDAVTTMVSGAAEFSASRTGALVYVPGGGRTGGMRSLVWVTRQGIETPLAGAPSRAYQIPRLSPDGTRVALDIRDQQGDIWVWDLARQTLTRLTDAPDLDQNPVWTPDGRRVLFASARAGFFNLFWQAANNTGTVERLTTSPNLQLPMSTSPDGTRLIVRETMPTTGLDLRVLHLDTSTAHAAGPSTALGAGPLAPLRTPPRQTEALLQTTFNEVNGEISPDGHWLAYDSNESGRNEISVRPFPNVDAGHWTISTGGGTRPLWARSGTELFYLDGSGAMTRVPLQTTPAFTAGTPTTLFDTRYYAGGPSRPYDVSPDGQRFLMIKNNADRAGSMVVVLNWPEELKAKLPSK